MNNHFKNLPNRKSIRLRDWDYSSQGYYFITIGTHDRVCLFGKIVNGKMVLNDVGKIIKHVWRSLPQHHLVRLDTFQIMPNHIHFIIQIVGATRGSPEINQSGGSRPAPTRLGTITGLFKSECTKQIRHLLDKQNFMVWQRNYYEHIIRNKKELDKIREYIQVNPIIWKRDRNNPDNFNKKLGVIL